MTKPDRVFRQILLMLLCAILGTALHATTDGQTAVLKNLELSATELVMWCPMSDSPDSACPKNGTRVNVRTSVDNPKSQAVKYRYVVSGGEIIGQGASVVWDLSKAVAGNYTITVGLGGDGVIRGKTITKTVRLNECPVCDLPCICPSISIEGPAGAIGAGDAFVVRAEVRGGEDEKYRKMTWRVSEGSIVEGQGTTEVLIRTVRDMGSKMIKVTFTISTACETCPNSVTQDFPVNSKKLEHPE